MSGLLDSVLELEEGVAQGKVPLGTMPPGTVPGHRDGAERRLDLLFRLLLMRLLCHGTGAGTGAREGAGAGEETGGMVGSLLRLSEESAEQGMVGADLPARVRDDLRRAAESLRVAGAWREDSALWWEPLPEAGRLENQWRWLAGRGLKLPSTDQDGVALQEGAIPAAVVDRVFRELSASEAGRDEDSAPGEGPLGLEAEGVGSDGRTSHHRSDTVRYLTGREPELLRHLPWLALLVQHCLIEVAPRLAGHPALRERLGGLAPAAPQTAMLARYAGGSGGYSRHLDNPGGDSDNGRALSLVLYLNPADHRPRGGELEVWPTVEAAATASDAAPRSTVPPWGGNAVLADARRVPHRVKPLKLGPARWTLVLWFRDDRPSVPPPPLEVPDPASLLLGIQDPPVPEDKVLLREVVGDANASVEAKITVLSQAAAPVRAGAVVTTYGAGPALETWCRHHLDAGLDHLLVVLDRPDEPEEQKLAVLLAERFDPHQLTVWRGPEVAVNSWPGLRSPQLSALHDAATAGAAGSARDASSAVAARQSLHASAALEAARGDEFGGAPLAWLLHLDDDEWLVPQGAGRGGSNLANHFTALDASDLALVRYLVHEILHEAADDQEAGTGTTLPRFKLNPTLARLRLGNEGWKQVRARLGDRPYFLAHTNGKAAVRVEAGTAAAGVHSWHLADPAGRTALLNGPDLLHLPSPSPAAFARKLGRRAAGAKTGEIDRLFPPGHAEAYALRRLSETPSRSSDEILESLYREIACFNASDIQILEAAGLVVTRELRLDLK